MIERQCEGYRKKLTMNVQELEFRVLKALYWCGKMLTVQEWMAAKASVCDMLRFGVACCLISITGDSVGTPVID